MIYQFEHEEIKSCEDCPMCNKDFMLGLDCSLSSKPVDGFDIPDWCSLEVVLNDCKARQIL